MSIMSVRYERRILPNRNFISYIEQVHVARGLNNPLSAVHYAITTDNIPMLKILLDDIKTPKKKRCPFPIVSMIRQDTGR